MTGESTSLALPNSARKEWQQWRDFLRRPALPDNPTSFGAAARGTLRMLSLDLMVMTVLITALISLVAFGLDLPKNSLNDLEMNVQTIALIVLIAPLVEEIAFRSWLSGKPGHVLAILSIGLALIGAAIAGFQNTGAEASAGVGLAILAGFLIALVALFALRKRPPMGWFRTIFPGFFWLSTLAFALVHLANYTEGALAILLPLVLPQFVLGSILGYVRVHYGLWSAIALHMAHNGLIVLVVLAAASRST